MTGNERGALDAAPNRFVQRSAFIVCGAALVATVGLSVVMGAVAIPPLDVLLIMLSRLPLVSIQPHWPAAAETILFSIRLPRTVLVALTGAALGGSGAAYQGLFRNPLADPYLIGIASGAGFAAVVAMAVKWPATAWGWAVVPAAAFAGALITVALVYNIARVGRSTPVTTLILAGVAVGSFATALTAFLMLRSDSELRRAMSWMLGGFTLGGWVPVVVALPYVAASLAMLVALARPLNVLQFGDDQARQMGLNVERIKLVLVLAASLATASAVAFSGIIGFVGLAVPHLMRLLWGPDYRGLVPLSIIGGAAFLLLADVAARTVLAPQEVPVGIITALVGVPFFLWLLRRAKQQTFW